MKRCSQCRKEKPFDSFRQRSASKDGLLSMCKPCDDTSKAWREANKERLAANSKRWYEENRERAKANIKAWREANPERDAATRKAWREANRERAAAATKAWEEANPERVKARREANRERAAARTRAWYAANKERAVAANKAWREANPDKESDYGRRRRARLRGVVTEADLPSAADLIAATGGICPHCDEAPQNWEIDHIWPISKGGPNVRENLQAICKTCNGRKSARLPDQEYPYPPWWDYDVVRTCVDIALEHDEADLL